MSQPPDKLTRSQQLLLSAVEHNQTALIDRIDGMLKEIQVRIEELAILVAAVREWQEAHERASRGEP